MSRLVLGINAYHGDASAAALVDGKLVAAAEEERFSRVKHAAGFPVQALRYVTAAAGGAVDRVVLAVPRNPWARVLHKALFALRRPAAIGSRVQAQGRFASIGAEAAAALGIAPERVEVKRVEHHRAHLASSFFMSPFEEAALLSIDGLGDFASAMWGVGRGQRMRAWGAVAFPHSLGILYTALTQYLGFPRYGDEYKVMGLASYGEPEFLDELREMVAPAGDNDIGFRLGLDYFTHQQGGVDMTWDGGEPTIGRLYSDLLIKRLGPPRRPEEAVEPRHRNLAASLQRRLEEIVLANAVVLRQRSGLRALCLAGGVAFNCVANGRLLSDSGFDEIYVQSAAGDAGLAIGAAKAVWHEESELRETMVHSYWGPEFDDKAIENTLASRQAELAGAGVRRQHVESEEELCASTASALSAGKIVGWFQGRMEWGPRALGHRSILADPRRAEVRDVINAKIKRREMFRPFAPSILAERTAEFFEQSYPSPFMLMAYRVRAGAKARIPATTHVDGTGRLQTVDRAASPRFHRLLQEFDRQTGVPVLLNTSFNENEPVVCEPSQAIDCFLRTRMDVLVLGNHVVERAEGRFAPTLPSGPPRRE